MMSVKVRLQVFIVLALKAKMLDFTHCVGRYTIVWRLFGKKQTTNHPEISDLLSEVAVLAEFKALKSTA